MPVTAIPIIPTTSTVTRSDSGANADTIPGSSTSTKPIPKLITPKKPISAGSPGRASAYRHASPQSFRRPRTPGPGYRVG